MFATGTKMKDLEIIATDSKNISEYQFCGYKDSKNEGHNRKSKWLKKRFSEGLKFKILHSKEFGDIGMIEYVPGDNTWRPIEAKDYMVIHCIMTSGKHKGRGHGKLLLKDCIKDAKKNGFKGVAVATSSGSFMANGNLFLANGFKLVDTKDCYDLLVKKFKASSQSPKFTKPNEKFLKKYNKGLVIFSSDQCPMVPKWTKEIAEVSRELGFKPKIVTLNQSNNSRSLGTAYGMFCILLDGKILVDRPVSARRFSNILQKL